VTDASKTGQSRPSQPSLRAIEGGSSSSDKPASEPTAAPAWHNTDQPSPEPAEDTTQDSGTDLNKNGQAAAKASSEIAAESPAPTALTGAKAAFRPAYAARKRPPAALAALKPDPAFDHKTALANPTSPNVAPVAGPAMIERRHWGLMISFLVVAVLPIVFSAIYLWGIARDQYASTVAFSIRKEEVQSSLGLLGSISKLSGSGGDAQVLYEFIRSQELVATIDKKLDLRRIYSVGWPDDIVFSYDPDGTVEDLLRHWKRKVNITYDSGSSLMTLQVLAFSAEDATAIANEILDESTRMINALSADAREDATRYARAEVDRSVERLKQARSELTAFRLRTRIVDPQADLQGQMGVLNSLQAQLADSLVELDLLRGSAREDDPRIQQASRRIEVIESRLASEREKFGEGGQGPSGEDYATLVADFERLTVDREFAETTYRAALVSYDAALAEAQRKSLYLAAYIQPTKAERSDFPSRWTLLGLTAFFILMAWSIGVLLYYSVRDRR
jgi:capsular polysaccharide transport system permease protein